MIHIQAVLRLMRWHQPIGILLLLGPTLWALVVASQGTPDLSLLLIFTLGTIVMRSAGCVINDLCDKDIDYKVQRTRERPLARGDIHPRSAIFLAVLLIVLACGLVMLLNYLAILLAGLGLLGTIFYPLAKRFILVPQLVLGLVFAWGVPMAYAAQAESLPPLAWFLYGINGLWIMAYDTQYALCDKADDIKLGIHSSALYFGDRAPLVIVLCQLMLLSGLLLLGWFLGLALGYYIMLGLGALIFVYHWIYTRGYEDPTACFMSFRGNHWFGWFILTGFFLGFDTTL